MIKANFNAYSTYVTDSLYQWDINQVLTVSGLNLSVAPEVHFSNSNMDKAIVRQATLENHIVSVGIPNSLLQSPLTINAHIGIYEGDTFKVIELVQIPIIPKKRPLDYKIENSDEEIYSFEQLKNHIANMVKISDFNTDKVVITARIDNIIAHNNDTEGNSELVDIRVGANGKTYDSAGEAVRNQFADLTDNLYDITSKIRKEKFTKFEDIGVSGGALVTGESLGSVCRMAIIKMAKNLTYNITAKGKFSRWSFYVGDSKNLGDKPTLLQWELVSNEIVSEKNYLYVNESGYLYLFVFVDYNTSNFSCELSVIETYDDGSENFSINGIPVYPKGEIDELLKNPLYFNQYVSDLSVSLVTKTENLYNLYDSLVETYPEYISKNILGQNKSGVNLVEYVLNSGNFNEKHGQRGQDNVSTKPTILILTGVHGYERSSIMSTYQFVKDLCEYNKHLFSLRENYIIKVVPVMNPYSFDKNSRTNENGVNLNRNFSKYWILSGSGTEDYSGASANDQLETQIITKWIDDNSNAVLFVDHHNSGYADEVAYLAGTNDVNNINNLKNAFLKKSNELKCYFVSEEKFDNGLLFGYTGYFAENGMSYFYAEDKGILSVCLETSWNQNHKGLHSDLTIKTGAEILGNFLIAFDNM